MRNGKGLSKSLLGAVAIVGAMGIFAADGSARTRLKQWQTIENDRYGFMIAYPGSVFAPRDAVPSEDGNVLVSHDGGARLLVGAFANDTEATMAEYREQLLTENYQGADIDYAPIRKRFFVLSGTRGDMHFYERVSFTCGGKLINSWALLYPVSERRTYDRIVEAIARTYSPGTGQAGECE